MLSTLAYRVSFEQFFGKATPEAAKDSGMPEWMVLANRGLPEWIVTSLDWFEVDSRSRSSLCQLFALNPDLAAEIVGSFLKTLSTIFPSLGLHPSCRFSVPYYCSACCVLVDLRFSEWGLLAS